MARLLSRSKPSPPRPPGEWTNKNVVAFLAQHDLHAYSRAARKAKLRGAHLLDVATAMLGSVSWLATDCPSSPRGGSRVDPPSPKMSLESRRASLNVQQLSPWFIRRASATNEALAKLCEQLGMHSDIDRQRLWIALIMLAEEKVAAERETKAKSEPSFAPIRQSRGSTTGRRSSEAKATGQEDVQRKPDARGAHQDATLLRALQRNKSLNRYAAYAESHGQLVIKCCLDVVDQDNVRPRAHQTKKRDLYETPVHKEISLIRLDAQKPLLFGDFMHEVRRLHGQLLSSVEQQHREIAGVGAREWMRIKYEDREGDSIKV